MRSTLLLIVLVAAPLAQVHPTADAGRDPDGRRLSHGRMARDPGILRLSAADRLVWAATFLLTVFADLTVAVEVGMVLAALLYIHRVSETTTVDSITDDDLHDGGGAYVLTDKYIPAYVSVVRIRGPFLFGATEKLEHATADAAKFGEIVVLEALANDGDRRHRASTLSNRSRPGSKNRAGR